MILKNIYLDFDRTIYNTDKLYEDMNHVIAKYGISLKKFNQVKEEIFEQPILFNYFKVIEYICDNDSISKELICDLKRIISNGDIYIYKDVINFLDRMKKSGLNIIVLTYGDPCFQMMKMSNLCIYDVVNQIIITNKYKFELELDYNNSVFIDDNPRDLIGFYEKNAGKVIRIARKNSKYSNRCLNNKNIISYSDLNNVEI